MSSARENLAHSSEVTNDDLENPFASGAFRWVCHATYTSGQRNKQLCVWKWFKSGSVFASDFFKYDVLAIEKAIEIVSKFNAANIIDKPILVNRAEVWTGRNGSVKNQKFLVEPYIKNWEKFNSNSGWVSNQTAWDLIMQALSHFSYHASGGSLVLCDLQGGILKNGAVIPDPVIMSRNRPYGVTDLGEQGIINFFSKHTCNDYCSPEWTRPKYHHHYYKAQQGTSMMQLGQDAPHAPTYDKRNAMTLASYDDDGYD